MLASKTIFAAVGDGGGRGDQQRIALQSDRRDTVDRSDPALDDRVAAGLDEAQLQRAVLGEEEVEVVAEQVGLRRQQ